jgi:hypothetical protein
MSVIPLHQAFLSALNGLLTDWTFVDRHRHFKLRHGRVNWIAHVACVDHESDFDAVIDVAVEFLSGRARACIVGAELGNIAGSGQRRYGVASIAEAGVAAARAGRDIAEIGIPFLQTHSSPAHVIRVLEGGGAPARLISAFAGRHAEQVTALRLLDADDRDSSHHG